MKRRLLRLSRCVVGAVILFVASTSISPSARANDWYETAPSDCSGTNAVITAFVALLPSSVPVHPGSGSTYYAEAPIRLVSDLEKSGGEKIVDTLVFNKKKADDYRNAMKVVASSYQVPYFFVVAAAVYTGMVLSPGLGTAAGLVFSYLLDQLNQPAVAVTGFTAFIAEGGELDRRWKLLKNQSNGYYLIDSMEYVVSVGSERRRFVTTGCSYPVKISVSEFKTNDQFNKKIVTPQGAVWRVFDVEGNKWDSTVLKYSSQDEQFFYFTEDAIENGNVVGQNIHKISFVGGPWQYKAYNSTDGKFKSFYTSVSAM
jgi:hypothetical protein